MSDARLSGRPGATTAAATVVGAALVAWAVSAARMHGLDAGAGSDMGGVAWFVATWVTMMAAMMLPSVGPMALVFARVSGERSRRGRDRVVPTWIFLAGYLAAWTLCGLLAYALHQSIHRLDPGFLADDAHGRLLLGGTIAAAGLYQLTPLKQLCLRHCRTPLQFVAFRWRDGALGAVRMGTEHGAYCVGCCVGLMLVLFAVGLMSLTWMAVIAAVIFAEKVLPFGARLSRPLALTLLVLGATFAAWPGGIQT